MICLKAEHQVIHRCFNYWKTACQSQFCCFYPPLELNAALHLSGLPDTAIHSARDSGPSAQPPRAMYLPHSLPS